MDRVKGIEPSFLLGALAYSKGGFLTLLALPSNSGYISAVMLVSLDALCIGIYMGRLEHNGQPGLSPRAK